MRGGPKRETNIAGTQWGAVVDSYAGADNEIIVAMFDHRPHAVEYVEEHDSFQSYRVTDVHLPRRGFPITEPPKDTAEGRAAQPPRSPRKPCIRCGEPSEMSASRGPACPECYDILSD